MLEQNLFIISQQLFRIPRQISDLYRTHLKCKAGPVMDYTMPDCRGVNRKRNAPRVGITAGVQGLQRELRSGAEAGPLPRAQGVFHVSPLASLEDLQTTHDRGYVERYLQGRFTDVRNQRVHGVACVRAWVDSFGSREGSWVRVTALGDVCGRSCRIQSGPRFRVEHGVEHGLRAMSLWFETLGLGSCLSPEPLREFPS